MADTKKMPKLDFQLFLDRLFRRKVFLDPQPDGSFKAVTINGVENGYYKDDKGATLIRPSRIIEVRGLKNVRYICFKRYNQTELADMFGEQPWVECPTCHQTVWSGEEKMNEKTFSDIIDIAESAGRLQAEKENNPAANNQMKMMMFMIAGVGILVLWMIMSGGK